MSIVPAAITRHLGRSLLQFKKQSPHIFFAGGIVGTVASTVLACRATLKLGDVLEEFEKDLVDVRELGDRDLSDELYREREYYMDTFYVYAKGTLRVVKLYAPSIVLGSISVAALTGSHVTLARRNTALTAAAATLAKAYDEYRLRVQEELGADREKEIQMGIDAQEFIDEKGNKDVINLIDTNKLSPYAKFFDEYSPNWEKDPELNRLFVQCQQNYANHLLNARGHVFLNEVYDMLGIERTSAGSVVGWIRKGEGDGFVDFGIFEVVNRDFVNGWERSILLDFNVDGVIYDKI